MQSTLKSAQCLQCGDGPRLSDDPFVLVVQSIRKCADKHQCTQLSYAPSVLFISITLVPIDANL